MKKLDIENINSPACEQAFKWLNGFKNMKKMNQGRFKFFFLYMVECHNLHIEKKVHTIANPLSHERIENIRSKKYQIAQKEPQTSNVNDYENVQVEVPNNMRPIANEEHPSIDDCFSMVNEKMKCKYCEGTYQKKGQLKNHIESKHGISINLKCSCGKVFSELKAQVRHQKTCKIYNK